MSLGFFSAVAYWPTPRNELAVARSRWQARSFDQYQLSVEYTSSLGRCRQTVEVADNQIVQVATNSCLYPAKTTVAELFAMIEPYVRSQPCGPNGCACDGHMTADVLYDPQFGFPQKIVIHSQIAGRWMHLDYWRNLWENHGRLRCAVAGYRGPHLDVVSLVPMNVARSP